MLTRRHQEEEMPEHGWGRYVAKTESNHELEIY